MSEQELPPSRWNRVAPWREVRVEYPSGRVFVVEGYWRGAVYGILAPDVVNQLGTIADAVGVERANGETLLLDPRARCFDVVSGELLYEPQWLPD